MSFLSHGGFGVADYCSDAGQMFLCDKWKNICNKQWGAYMGKKLYLCTCKPMLCRKDRN